MGCLAEVSISRSGRVSEALGLATQKHQGTMAIMSNTFGSAVLACTYV